MEVLKLSIQISNVAVSALQRVIVGAIIIIIFVIIAEAVSIRVMFVILLISALIAVSGFLGDLAFDVLSSYRRNR